MKRSVATAWPWSLPLGGIGAAALALAWPGNGIVQAACALALIGSVLASVHHSEVVAHRVGEPFGTLVLAVAVTVIEAALIVSVMLSGGADKAALPRDTIFSAIMIVCNGAVGLCIVTGAVRFGEQRYRSDGALSALAALAALATLSLVLPSLTKTTPGPEYSRSQLAFAALASLALWAVFVFVQTVRHRDYFLPPRDAGRQDPDAHADPPTVRQAWTSGVWLVVSLAVVIGLAKLLSPAIERGVAAAGLPASVIAIVIALLVLAPETWAALRAALADRLQTSLNLALGSALASIGLTIPVVAALSVLLDLDLALGLDPKEATLLALTFFTSALTLGIGRTNVLLGAVQLMVFLAFLLLAIVP